MGFFVCFVVSVILTVLIAVYCYKCMKPVSNATEAGKYMDKAINLSIKSDTFIRTEKKKKKDD